MTMTTAQPAQTGGLGAGRAPRGRRRTQPRSGSSRVVGQKWWTPYLFMLPGLGFFVFMFAWPALLTFQLSVSQYNIVDPIQFVGADNFLHLLTDPRFHRALANSMIFLVLFLPLAVIIPLFLAVLVNQKVPGIQTFRVLYYLPVVTSMVAVAVAWRYLLGREGVVNWILGLVGVPPISFLLDTAWALPTVVMIEGWKNMGLFMMIYLAGLQAIPAELIEAAKVDGASPWRRLIHVIVPGILPWVTVTLTMGMLEAMRSFESIFMLTRGGPQDSTLTLGYYIWHLAFEKYDMGYASTVGLVLWVIMIVLALLNQKVTNR